MKDSLWLKYKLDLITINKILKYIWMGLIEMSAYNRAVDFPFVFYEGLISFSFVACPRNGKRYIVVLFNKFDELLT